MSEEIFVVGYPKSGNTWLSRLIGDALGSEVKAFGEQKSLADWKYGDGKYIIRQMHTTEQQAGKIVLLVRDPRDVVVSAFFYWQRKSMDEYFSFMDNKENKKPPNILYGWPEFYRMWTSELRTYHSFVRYEDLLGDTENELTIVLGELGVDIPNGERLKRVVKRNSFNKMRKTIANAPDDKYMWGKEIQLRNLRKGIAGDWEHHLKRRHGKMIHENMWYWIRRYGYETNPNWWKYLEE